MNELINIGQYTFFEKGAIAAILDFEINTSIFEAKMNAGLGFYINLGLGDVKYRSLLLLKNGEMYASPLSIERLVERFNSKSN